MTTYTLRIIVDGKDKASGPLSGIPGAIGRIGEIAAGILTANIFSDLAAQVMSGASAFANYAKESVLAASRVNELALVNNVLAQNAGVSADAVHAQVEAVRKMGIEAAVAQGVVASMLRSNLDWTRSAEIARVAQDAAVIAGVNSSEATERIIHGITTMNPLILRNAGLIVDSREAYEEYAKTLGKSASQLTSAEKQAAFLNATLKAGEGIAGAYMASMDDPGKVLRSFPRYLDDIKVAFGQPFQGAFKTGIFAAADWTKALGKAMLEGGALYPVLERLGQAADGLADKFAKWIGSVDPVKFFTDLGERAEYFIKVLDRIQTFGFRGVIMKPYVWANMLGIDSSTWNYLNGKVKEGIGILFAGIGVGGTGIFAGISLASIAGPLLGILAALPALLGSKLGLIGAAVGGKLFTGLLMALSGFSPLLGGAFFRLFMTGGIAESIGKAFLSLGGRVGGFFKFLLPLAPLMGSVLGLFALAVVALAAFGVVLKALSGDTAFFTGISEKFLGGLKGIGNFWSEQGPKIAEIGAQVWAALSDAATQLAEKVMPWLAEQFEKFGVWFEENGPLITETIAVLADFFTNHLLPAIVGFWDVVEPILTSLLDGIGGIATAIMQAITGDWEGAGETLKGVFEGLWEGIKETFTAFLDWVTGWFGTDWATVSSTWASNWEMFKEIVALAWDKMVSWISDKTAEISGSISSWWTDLNSQWDTNWNLLGDIVKNTWLLIIGTVTEKIAEIAGIISGGASDLYGAGTDLLQGLLDGIKSIAGDVIAFVTGLAADIAEAFAGVLDMRSPSRVFVDYGENIGQGLVNGMKTMTRSIEQTTSSMAQATMSPFAAAGTVSGGTTYNTGGINITVNGAGDPDAVANAIMRQLRAQGVGV